MGQQREQGLGIIAQRIERKLFIKNNLLSYSA